MHTCTGMVDAHTGEVITSWNALQTAMIPAIVGNSKVGREIVNIDVEQIGNGRCRHIDRKRRVHVRNLNFASISTL